MTSFMETLLAMLGRTPKQPAEAEITQQAKARHLARRNNQERVNALKQALKQKPGPKKWQRRRWSVLIAVNLFFLLSYKLDIQILEGALTASRFIGFHLADLNSALHVMLAFKQVLINLLIGSVTAMVLWWLLGGRTFCSWVCPYHLLAEWAEVVHLYLARKKIVRDHPMHRGMRSVLWLVFGLLSFVTGYTIFEIISPTGILSRALIYGSCVALVWVAILLLFEIFYSRRGWCRYICPIGLTYGVIGSLSPLKVVYNMDGCFHEGNCRKVCLVPHVLSTVIKGRARDVVVDIGADCTRCGKCIDVCPTGALTYRFKGFGDRL